MAEDKDPFVQSNDPRPSLNGLVPVRVNRHVNHFNPGEVGGFSPEMAAEIVRRKHGEYQVLRDVAEAEAKTKADAEKAKTPEADAKADPKKK